MNLNDLVLSLGIGILVTCAVYIGLRRAFRNEPALRRAVILFAAVAGIVVTFFLRAHPALLEEWGTQIVLALLGVVLVLIALARRHVSH